MEICFFLSCEKGHVTWVYTCVVKAHRKTYFYDGLMQDKGKVWVVQSARKSLRI